jgi:hypothetical protein
MQWTCRQCSVGFEITDEDLLFYDKISPVFAGKKEQIPSPTLCPVCRSLRRLSWRNEFVLYRRTSGVSGKSIISVYSPDVPFPVYENREWWSDTWEPLSYGRKVDLSRSFLEQWKELHNVVPQIAIMNDNNTQSENCEFCHDFAYGKNCYLVTAGWYMEDCLYNDGSMRSKNLVDCYFTFDSELCYECLNSQRLYHCFFLQDSEQCTDCVFGFDLKSCESCIGCVGLRQKKFHIFNQPYSEDEYREKLKELNLGSHQSLEALRTQFAEWSRRFPRQPMHLQNCEDCKGDQLFHCKSTLGYNTIDGECCKFVDTVDTSVWSYDLWTTGRPQHCYEGVCNDDSYLCMSTISCWSCRNTYYCDNCHSSEYLFGCNGLRRAKYCILNKQYTKEEYEELVPKIIERMRVDEEWGEFFPTGLSPYGYNETIAQEYRPLAKEEVLGRGWPWRDREEGLSTDDALDAALLPDHIDDVEDGVLEQEIRCQQTQRRFRIMKAELDFYRRMKLPVPRLHPDERRRKRNAMLRSRTLWQRNCANCQKAIETTYAPDRPEIVYCEDCYLKTVY